MSDRTREDFDGAADQLSQTLVELEKVDLNPLLDDDVRSLVDAKADLQGICHRLRRNGSTTQNTSGEAGDADV